MFELRTFSADSKVVEFFHELVVEFKLQVYMIGATCLHAPEQPIEQMRVAYSLKGPKIILDMADRHVSKDGPF